MNAFELTPGREEEARRIEDVMRVAALTVEFRNMARLPARRENWNLFGQTEFLLRDVTHRIGAKGPGTLLFRSGRTGIPGGRASSLPRCREDARFDCYRAFRIKTFLEEETMYERASCHCSRCHQEICLTDRELVWFISRLSELAK